MVVPDLAAVAPVSIPVAVGPPDDTSGNSTLLMSFNLDKIYFGTMIWYESWNRDWKSL